MIIHRGVIEVADLSICSKVVILISQLGNSSALSTSMDIFRGPINPV
jgi:hypothetical protein